MTTQRMFAAYLAASAVLVTTQAALSGMGANVAFVSIEALAVVIAIHGVRLRPRGSRTPWTLLALALAMLLVGDSIHMVVPDHLLHPAMLTFADALFLVAYGALGVAGYFLVRTQNASHGLDGIIDGAIVSIAAGVVFYHLLQAQSVGTTSSGLARLVLIATPLLVIVGLVTALRAAVMSGRLARGPWLLVAAATLSVTGSLVLAANGGSLFEHDLTVVDVCWSLAFALAGAAAIPTVRDQDPISPPPTHTPHISYARLGVLATALVAAPVAMLTWPTGSSAGPVVPAVASLLITVLVVLRLARLVVDRERTQQELRTHSEQQAGLARLGDLALGEVGMADLSTAATELVTAVTRARSCAVVDERPGSAAPGDDLWMPVHGAAATWLVADLPAPTETDRLFLAAVANILGGASRQRATEAALIHQARHDPLTGLPNRLVLTDRLTHALARRSHEPVSLLLLDLDGFKAVNDQLGHDAGDRLLQQVAARLGDCLRASDTLVRLGGDEFTVIVEDLDQDGAIDLANRLTAALADPFALPASATVGASIGLARAQPGDDSDSLLRRADAAMYRAKATNATRPARPTVAP